MKENVCGYVHSFQSLGAVDGPGLRCVVFMQGCPLRCAYCHNPDTWALPDQAPGCRPYTPEQMAEKISRYKVYLKNGGVTVSGGEALMQPDFVRELFILLKKEGIHTALDTSCVGNPEKAAQVLSYTDLVLADLKFSNREDYKIYCGASMEQVLDFIRLTQTMEIPLWIRHVVVPGLNDRKEQILETGRIASQFTNLEKFELLPFRKICMSKYEQMGIDFPLKDHEACSEKHIKALEEFLRQELGEKLPGLRA